jgi:hypothetical protein
MRCSRTEGKLQRGLQEQTKFNLRISSLGTYNSTRKEQLSSSLYLYILFVDYVYIFKDRYKNIKIQKILYLLDL